ncbi:hypothetical protein [Halobiforma nitratireducens]|uniref:Uncharacterized protein n=1 Tax=Halobiforma nitratireducens JCM 10879 TaxID=1227454 RepID=M0LYZ5_9EURY|nr:hypothetical protein [Halobiforma nitratireducens]EMA37345.1 hypothetical protein C446_10830 [Halobiforma nitratireducens JCM 10879]
MDARRRGTILLVGCTLVTAAIYVVLVPRLVLEGARSRALLYVGIGWVPYTCLCYALGRLFSTPETLPNMRAADVGLGLFLVALLLSLGLDAWGFTPEAVPEAHVLQAIGVFVGLALFGWGLGRRSKALAATETTADSE